MDLHPDIDSVLIDAVTIEARLVELAAEVEADYRSRDLVLVGVLKGAFVVMADFARHLGRHVELDFMAVSSYGSATQTSGVVRILKDLDLDIAGRNVLIVEDIVDSGLTLAYLMRNLRARKPASLDVFTLLHKPDVTKVQVDIRYRGFEVPDVFVVGYGLDYAERYRNLPYIGTLKAEVYQHTA